MNRFSKDVDTLDNLLAGSFAWPRHVIRSNPIIPDSFRIFIASLSNIIGAILFVSVILSWFLIAVAVVSVFYIMATAFYRASAREMKVRVSKALYFEVFTDKVLPASGNYLAIITIFPFL
jgi:hypothetical protein